MKQYRVALAGNPNTGKSTLFNLLTGLRQHTGNWTGKTVVRAEGEFEHQQVKFQMIDLPGTYSLYSNSADEEVARDYILFEQPDVTVVVLDATSLQRNMNLALQMLEISDTVILCINLIDEAAKRGIIIDEKSLSRRLGVPVVQISARSEEGITHLLDTILAVVTGKIICKPVSIVYRAEIEQKIEQLVPVIHTIFGTRFPPRWIALRLLDGDEELLAALQSELQRKKYQELTGYGQSFGLNT